MFAILHGATAMYHNLSDILGYQIQASDKPAGTVEDIFIEDILWTVRHVAIADAGGIGEDVKLAGRSGI